MAVDCPEDQIDDLELNNRFVKPFQLNIYQRHKLYFFFFLPKHQKLVQILRLN